MCPQIGFSTLLYTLIVVGFSIQSSSAQFPAICVSNATKPLATCCPIPPGECVLNVVAVYSKTFSLDYC